MRKSIKVATMLVAGATMLAACANREGFKRTDNGLYYKFERQNPDGLQLKEGDVMVGEMTIRLDSTILYTNKGNVGRIAESQPVTQNFEIKIGEGLLMMHVGDVATFAMDADTAAKYVQREFMPAGYKEGTGQKFYYEINLQDIITRDEVAQERANIEAAMEERRMSEPDDIAEYIEANKITAQPSANGLYVIVKKRGNGPKVAMGKEVSMNYTGRLLDGTIFDTSVESDARSGGIYDARAPYKPITYVVGRDKLIDGWEQGVMGQAEGTVLQLVIPSALAYGPRQKGKTILPYSPLTFDIEIVSVK